MLRAYRIGLLCGLITTAASGCGSSGPKLYPVTGTITFDGKPVEGANVVYSPQSGRPIIATTDASGKYSLTTNGKPGAPAGAYSVVVTKQSGGGPGGQEDIASLQDALSQGGEPSDEIKQKMFAQNQGMAKLMQDSPKITNLLPERYAIPEASGLSANVTSDASKNVFDFALVP